MDPELADYLHSKPILATETAVWGNGRLPLQITYYQTQNLPPLKYVTSMRAVMFRNGRVMIVRDGHNSYHVVPGGRREAGETIIQTLHREVLEETGWTIVNPELIACAHFHHLSPKPVDYPYPHPEFLQLIFVAQADEYKPEAKTEGEYELETDFRPIADAQTLPLSTSQRLLLQVAITITKTGDF